MTRHVLDRTTLTFEVVIRVVHESDLEGLEWYGLFWRHREIIQRTFDAQQRGSALMLMADLNGFPVGQVWIDFDRLGDEGTAVLWAVRVYPFLQNTGLGGRLLRAAERVACARGFVRAEIGVEHDNPGARRLYERLGYRVVGQSTSEFTFTRPDGEVESVPLREWHMRKRLAPAASGRDVERSRETRSMADGEPAA